MIMRKFKSNFHFFIIFKTKWLLNRTYIVIKLNLNYLLKCFFFLFSKIFIYLFSNLTILKKVIVKRV